MEIQGSDFVLLFILTLILLGVKLILAIYLGNIILKNKKARGYLEYDFLFGFFILLLSLFISRIILLILDFFLTKENPEKYYLSQNVIFWKFGILIEGIGFAVFLFIIERVVMRFKLKGIISIFFLISLIFIISLPVNTNKDFKFISVLILIPFSLTLIIPIIFIYYGIKSPEIRKVSLSLAFGLLVFLIGTASVIYIFSEPLEEIFGPEFRITKFFPFYALKIIGLIIVSYCLTNLYIYNYFTKIDDEEI